MEYYENHQNDNDTSNYQIPPQKKESNNMAVASMVVGIVGMLGCCFFPVALICGVAAIVLAIMSKRGKAFSGFAVAGLVLGILAVIFGLLSFGYMMFASWLIRNNPDFFNAIMEQYESMSIQ